MRPLERVLEALSGAEAHQGYHLALCPAHEDRDPSLSVREAEDGKVLLHCFAGCELADVVAAAGLELSDLFPDAQESVGAVRRKSRPASPAGAPGATTTAYEIRGPTGDLVAVHERREAADGSKRFYWSTPGGGRGLGALKTPSLPLYGMEKLRAWPKEAPIVLVEGEKAADALLARKIRALGTATGANSAPSPEVLGQLAGRRIVLWPDADGPGREHMKKVARNLENAGVARIGLYEWTEAPPKGDAADHPAVRDGDERGLDALRRDLAQTLRAAEKGRGPTFSARSLMAKDIPPVRWVVPGLIPEGVTLLAGKPKLGKSWMALGFCVAVASGGRALGKTEVQQGTALYLALEDNERRLKGRLEKVLAGAEAPEGLELALDWAPLDDGGAEALDAWLTGRPDTRLVIVDTLQRVKPVATTHNQYAEDYAAMQPLMRLAGKHRVALVVVHHTRKGDAEDVLEEVSGTFGLTGAADGTLVLARKRGAAEAFLFPTGRDIEDERELALTWAPEIASWALAGDAEEFRLTKERQGVLRLLADAGQPLGPREVADALDKTPKAASELLRRMTSDGLLTSPRYGKYLAAPPSLPGPAGLPKPNGSPEPSTTGSSSTDFHALPHPENGESGIGKGASTLPRRNAQGEPVEEGANDPEGAETEWNRGSTYRYRPNDENQEWISVESRGTSTTASWLDEGRECKHGAVGGCWLCKKNHPEEWGSS